MKKLLVMSIIILLSNLLFAQQNPEQIALDYFIDSIYSNKYSNITKVQLALSTINSSDRLSDSFDCIDYSLLIDKIDIEGGRLEKFNLSVPNNVKTGKSKIALIVYPSFYSNNCHYVIINMWTKNESIDHYIFLINEYKVVKWCSFPEVI